jgi:predicted ArsR family transcriptional regulator
VATEASLHRALGDPSRARILEAVRGSELGLDVNELADKVGLHANTVRSHLRVLANAELVEARAEERHTRGRPRLVYVASSNPDAEPPAGYRLLAEILASELARSGEGSAERAGEAGKAWGRYLVNRRPPFEPSTPEADIDAVVRLLEEFGFDPSVEPEDEGHTVLMQHCPFGEVADHYRRIVCSVHLGLMQGALEELGGGVTADSLEPFVRPGVCTARLQSVA